jgi:hypothetical protein
MVGKKKKEDGQSSIKPKMARGRHRCECLPGTWYVDDLFSTIYLLDLLEDPLLRGGRGFSGDTTTTDSAVCPRVGTCLSNPSLGSRKRPATMATFYLLAAATGLLSTL